MLQYYLRNLKAKRNNIYVFFGEMMKRKIMLSIISIIFCWSSIAFAKDDKTPDLDVSFVKFTNHTFDGRNVIWVTLKIHNSGNITFNKIRNKTIGIEKNKKVRMIIPNRITSGFHNSPERYGVSNRKNLKPNEDGYLAFNIGNPDAKKIETSLTLENTELDIKIKRSVVYPLPNSIRPKNIDPHEGIDKNALAKLFNSIDMQFENLQDNYNLTSDKLILKYKIKNKSNRKITMPEKTVFYINYLLQRRGDDGQIKVLPKSSHRYGYTIKSRGVSSIIFRPKEVIPAYKEFYKKFQIYTIGYPPGDYRLYVELSMSVKLKSFEKKKLSIDFRLNPYPIGKKTYEKELDIRNHISNTVMQAFLDEDFEYLDKLSKDYRERKLKSPSGLWYLSFFYGGISAAANCDIKENEFWDILFSKSKKWIKESPKSPTAYIAHAIILKSYAWKYRGETYANKVPKKAWPFFRKYLNEARDILEMNKSLCSIDPEWYSLMIDLMKAQGDSIDSFRFVFSEGTYKEPLYYWLYFSGVDYLTPKWGGSIKAIEDFALKAVSKTKNQTGMSLYTRIYWYVSHHHKYRDKLFENSKADWNLMKQGIDDILKSYPDQWNINNFAYFACIAGDKEKAKELIGLIKGEPMIDVWKSKEKFINYKNWTNSTNIIQKLFKKVQS